MSENPSTIPEVKVDVKNVMDLYRQMEAMPEGTSDMAKAVLILAERVDELTMEINNVGENIIYELNLIRKK